MNSVTKNWLIATVGFGIGFVGVFMDLLIRDNLLVGGAANTTMWVSGIFVGIACYKIVWDVC